MFEMWKSLLRKNHYKKNILIKILANCIIMKNLIVIRQPLAMGDNDCFINFCSPYNPGTGLILSGFLPFRKERVTRIASKDI